MFRLSLFVLAASLLGGGTPARAEDSPFALEAEVVAALDGGPVVVRATLVYRGQQPIRVLNYFSGNAYIEFLTPVDWKPEGRMMGGSGPRYGERTLQPGDRWTEYRREHYGYTNIRPGKVEAVVRWPLRQKKDGPVIAEPSVPLHIDIAPATEANLAKVVAIIDKELNRLRPTCDDLPPAFGAETQWPRVPNRLGWAREERIQLARWLDGAHHPELLPAAYHILDQLPAAYHPGDRAYDDRRARSYALSFVYECRDSLRHPKYGVVDHLCTESPAGAVFLVRGLDYWQGKPPVTDPDRQPLRDEDWQRLRRAPSPWVRALLWAHFPGKCDKDFADRLLADLRRVKQPVPREAVAPLVARLDAGRFAVREEATRKLVALGEPAIPALEEALAGPLSAEAAERVRQALRRIASSSPAWFERQALAELERLNTPEADAAVRALMENMPAAWVTKEADAARGRMFQRRLLAPTRLNAADGPADRPR